jgi:phosphoribosylamine---glycine ligase
LRLIILVNSIVKLKKGDLMKKGIKQEEKKGKNILVVGSGGREHVLCWKLSQSKHVDKVFCAQGNGGTKLNINISPNDISALVNFAKDNNIDQTWVGPEDSLVKGIADAFEIANLNIIAPNKRSAVLEGSKIFAREFMKKYNIPIPNFVPFKNSSVDLGIEYINIVGAPIVVKADGLCAGKGVYVCNSKSEAIKAIKNLKNNFGSAGNDYILEECLVGPEVSLTLVTDGKSYKKLSYSRDHKRRFNNDKGPNTGGMGAYAPTKLITKELDQIIEDTIIEPTLEGLRAENFDYKGFLYIALMLTDEGPKVLEYNVRLGDPETQVIVPLNNNDWYELGQAIIEKKLDGFEWSNKQAHACCVVAVSKLYPGKYRSGCKILGLKQLTEISELNGFYAFHAGTKKDESIVRTAGGRVLGITALGTDHLDAVDRAYSAIKIIKFDNSAYRTDIGKNNFENE